VPELELRSVMAEQVMQIKNYAVPGPKFAPKMAGNWIDSLCSYGHLPVITGYKWDYDKWP
jgi:hypothetical protein